MKYIRLTKEQLKELHPEFINFLASQSIDKNEWDKLKKEKPELAEQEIDIFSDLIWEGVLNTTEYLEHFSAMHIFLFKCNSNAIESIVIRSLLPNIDFLTTDGLNWLNQNFFSENVEVTRATKNIIKDRNSAIFELIKQGAIISKGTLYNQIIAVL